MSSKARRVCGPRIGDCCSRPKPGDHHSGLGHHVIRGETALCKARALFEARILLFNVGSSCCSGQETILQGQETTSLEARRSCR